MSLIKRTKDLYGRFERPISSLSLILGFVFNSLTLKRVDTFWENIWIVVHLVLVGLFIALIHIKEKEDGDEKDSNKAHFWYVNILQFVFGGILSTYLVFYFRSTDIFATWPFIFLLIIAFIANESFKRHYIKFSFQISLFFLSIYSFAIFIIPVILHKIGIYVFILSGIISLIFIAFFIAILFYFIKEEFRENKKIILFLILGIFSLINLLYFTNLIPPIPLSLKDDGIFYSVQKKNTGNYYVLYENSSWKDYFKLYKDFKKIPEYSVYAYSAIFSPKNLNLTIIHEWEYYDQIKKEWVKETIIRLPVAGGRDGGFRTYSMRSNIKEGKWRVNVKTEKGQLIGRLRFNILNTNTAPELISGIK